MKNVENTRTHTAISRKLSAQRRGQDAILRERVRRDYQALIKNLEHLAQEERKLKANQVHCNAVGIYYKCVMYLLKILKKPEVVTVFTYSKIACLKYFRVRLGGRYTRTITSEK